MFACHSYDLDVDVLARAGAAVRGEGHTFIQCGADIVTSEGDTVARKASGGCETRPTAPQQLPHT